MATEHDSPAPAGASDDWAAQQADRIIDIVDTVKGYTTDRVVVVARGLIFGLVISVLALAAAVLFTVAMVRLADAYLPIGAGVGDATWAAHLFIGGLFSVLGLGAWASRRGEGTAKPLITAGIIDCTVVVGIICYGIIRGLT